MHLLRLSSAESDRMMLSVNRALAAETIATEVYLPQLDHVWQKRWEAWDSYPITLAQL